MRHKLTVTRPTRFAAPGFNGLIWFRPTRSQRLRKWRRCDRAVYHSDTSIGGERLHAACLPGATSASVSGIVRWWPARPSAVYRV